MSDPLGAAGFGARPDLVCRRCAQRLGECLERRGGGDFGPAEAQAGCALRRELAGLTRIGEERDRVLGAGGDEQVDALQRLERLLGKIRQAQRRKMRAAAALARGKCVVQHEDACRVQSRGVREAGLD